MAWLFHFLYAWYDMYLRNRWREFWKRPPRRSSVLFSLHRHNFSVEWRSDTCYLCSSILFVGNRTAFWPVKKFIQNKQNTQLNIQSPTIWEELLKPSIFSHGESSLDIATRVGRLGRGGLCKYASEVGSSGGQKPENSVTKNIHNYWHQISW